MHKVRLCAELEQLPAHNHQIHLYHQTLKLFATKFNNLFGKFEVGEIAIDQNNDKRYCADVSAVAAGRDYSGKIEVENDDYYSIYMTMEYADY